MTDEEICRRMEWPKAFLVCGDDFAVRIRALVRAAEAAEREACAALLDAEHERRKHLDNLAGVYARMIRERCAI